MARSSPEGFDQWAFAIDHFAALAMQNAYAERLIGSIQRECLDHVVVGDERQPMYVLYIL
jgi:hypothetical protein